MVVSVQKSKLISPLKTGEKTER
ncbi:MAG: hypothetical protein PWP24_1966, partial [Clostridiales bacterium]|nr:hypothetical protein [Clostridiales bacterium]